MESPICLRRYRRINLWIRLQSKELDRYRTAYKRRNSGHRDDEFIKLIPNKNKLLEDEISQKLQRYVISLYIEHMLNILDANVSAHLMQFNIKTT